MSQKIKRLQELNQIALAAYVQGQCGDLRSVSDPRIQGAELNLISIGMMREEQAEIDRIFEDDFHQQVKKFMPEKEIDQDIRPKNFRPEKV